MVEQQQVENNSFEAQFEDQPQQNADPEDYDCSVDEIRNPSPHELPEQFLKSISVMEMAESGSSSDQSLR